MNRLHRTISAAAVAIVLTSTAAVSHAQAARTWKEGPVLSVGHIRTLPGQFDNYMRYVYGDYAKLMNAQKDAGIITNWAVYTQVPRTPDEADVLLVVTYPNMAALDGLADRTRPIAQKVLGLTPEQTAARTVEREKWRKTLGSQLIRQQLPNL